MSGYTPRGLATTDSIVSDGQSIALKTAVGGDFPGAPVTAGAVVAARSLSQANLPGNEIVLKDQQESVNVNQYDNTGSFAATVNVASNSLTLTLANATTRIIVDALPATIEAAGGGTSVSGTLHVSSGALAPVKLAANVGVVQDTIGLQVPVTGIYTDTITPQVDAAGVITGFTLS